MIDLYEYIGKDLTWSPGKPGELILHPLNEQSELASLSFQGKFGSVAEGKCRSGFWNYKRSGLLKNNVSIFDFAGENEVAVFKKKGLGGTLEFDHGRKIFVQRDALMMEYSLSSADETLIEFHQITNQPVIKILPEAAENSLLPVLVLFLIYLISMQRVDASYAAPF